MPIKQDWDPGDVLTASQVSTYLANAGLDFIKEVFVGDNSVSYVDVTGAFSSTYKSYKIVYQDIEPLSGDDFYFRFVSSGTPVTTGYYCNAISIQPNTTTVFGEDLGDTGFFLFEVGPAASGSGSFDVHQPYIAAQKTMSGTSVNASTFRQVMGATDFDESYTDFRLTGLSSGTIRYGSIVVYGYRMT